jgi:DNA modification methylase
VIDPFCATGETGIAALRRGRDFLGIEPDPAHATTARERLARLS